jgi:arylsulfatase A-like enzyme
MAAARRQNLVYVFADQWRGQATGYAGDPNVQTPNLDRLTQRSWRFDTAVANCPVCTPSRACLITGRYPLSHGLFLNDAALNPELPSIGRSLKQAGYATGYIGKWHIDGPDRSAYIPPARRHGFDFWRGWNCTHNYNDSRYHADEDPQARLWQGYDAIEQTRVACDFIRGRADEDAPFALFMSWGPPHNPYQTAPQQFRELYDPQALTLRPNVPPQAQAEARKDLAGYYAHCSALDHCVGELLDSLQAAEQLDDTIFIFTSDHGDMLGSQGERRKQRPWDESILVPMVVHAPRLLGGRPRVVTEPFAIVDTMPTLLGLLGLEIPAGVEGLNHAPYWLGQTGPVTDAALIACYHPFGEWLASHGGREYRGVRTSRYTYVRTLAGPWLLYDNQQDPYQCENLIDRAQASELRRRLDDRLNQLLASHGDEFRPGSEYLRQWDYQVDDGGTLAYFNYK